MLFFVGPRLDRPSAVGDEGRPRDVSLSVASLVVVVLAVVPGVLPGFRSPMVILSAGVAAGSTAAGLALLKRDRFAPLCVGTLLAMPVAVPLWAQSLLGGGLRAGFALAMLGLALTWTDTGDRDDLERAVEHLGIGYGGLLLGTTGAVFLAVAVPVLAGPMFDRTSPMAGAVVFLFWLSLLGATVFVVLRVLPLVQLSPMDRRRWVRERRRSVRRVAAVVSIVAIGLSPVAAVVVPPRATSPFVGSLPVLSSPLVLGPMMATVAVGWVAVVVATLLERVAGSAPGDRIVAGAVVGAVLGALLALSPRLFGVSPILAGVLLLSGPVVVLVGVLVMVLLADLGVVPADASGTVLAAGGLAVATVAAALDGLPGAYVFACAAGTVVVWDVSRFGLGLTRELGHVPVTRRLELVHAVTVVGLGAVAAVLATLVYAVRAAAAPGVAAPAAMALAVIAALVVIAPLRG